MYAVITNTCVIYIFNVTTYVLTDALIIQYNSLYETNLISSNQHIFYTKERKRERKKDTPDKTTAFSGSIYFSSNIVLYYTPDFMYFENVKLYSRRIAWTTQKSASIERY